jgi:hypothetical protein
MKHYRQRESEKKAAKKLKPKKVTKKEEKSLKKRLHARCWKLMSEWVRRHNASSTGFQTCYTCGAIKHWSELHAGHYKHGKFDFDPRNLKPQCVKCNMFFSGRLDEYTMNLVRDYGIDWVQQLRNDASKHIGYSIDEMKAIEIELKDKLSTLAT